MLHRARKLVKPFVPEPALRLYRSLWGLYTRLVTGLRRLRLAHWLAKNAPELHQRIFRKDLPVEVRRHLLNRLAGEPYQRLANPGHKSSPLEGDILFVTDNPLPDIVKAVIALKRVDAKLHCSLLLRSFTEQGDFVRRYFDRVEEYGFGVDLIRWLIEAKARVLFMRGSTGYQGLLSRIFFDGRFVFCSDLKITHADQDPEAMIAQAERFMLRHCDLILHSYPEEVTSWLKHKFQLNTQIAVIAHACVAELGPETRLPKLSSRDGALHLVWAAGPGRKIVPPRTADGVPVDFLEKIRTIVNQKVHFHFYLPFVDESNLPPYFREYFEFRRESAYYHIERAVSYDRLLVELTQYDWAVFHNTLFGDIPGEERYQMLPNGFFTYIQAGLPVLYSPTSPYYGRILERYGVGAGVSEAELHRLEEKLQSFPKDGLEERFRKAREDLAYDHQALYDLLFGPKIMSKAGNDSPRSKPASSEL